MISIRITSLYGSQPSFMAFALQNSAFSIRIEKSLWVPPLTCGSVHSQQRHYAQELQSLYGAQTSPVVLFITTATLSPELIVSIRSQTSPVVLCMQNSVISTRITSLHWSQTSPVVLCMQTTWLSSELLVSMGPSLHLWFLHAKEGLLDQNYNSLWVPDFVCWFENAKQRA